MSLTVFTLSTHLLNYGFIRFYSSPWKRWFLVAACLVWAHWSAGAFAGASLINGDFESGNFTGWNTFTTSNGVISGNDAAGVYLFDVDGDGTTSLSARFQVGAQSFPPGGGGIYQTVSSGVSFRVKSDIAASSTSNNADAGLFRLLIDGVVHDSHSFGGISVGSVERSILESDIISAGTHEVRLLMTRYYGAGATPRQYIDNVRLIPVPELPTSMLATTGVMCLIWRRSAGITCRLVSSGRTSGGATPRHFGEL